MNLSSALRQSVPVDEATAHVGEWVLDDKLGGIERFDDPHHASDLQARDDAVEDFALVTAAPAARAIYGHAAPHLVEDRRADRLRCRRHHGDRRELFDA